MGAADSHHACGLTRIAHWHWRDGCELADVATRLVTVLRLPMHDTVSHGDAPLPALLPQWPVVGHRDVVHCGTIYPTQVILTSVASVVCGPLENR